MSASRFRGAERIDDGEKRTSRALGRREERNGELAAGNASKIVELHARIRRHLPSITSVGEHPRLPDHMASRNTKAHHVSKRAGRVVDGGMETPGGPTELLKWCGASFTECGKILYRPAEQGNEDDFPAAMFVCLLPSARASCYY